MELTTSSTTSIQMTAQTMQASRPEGPPPPPRGSTPPGTEDAVSTLTDEEQLSLTEMLASLSEEQEVELKSFLDDIKPLSKDLTDADMGSLLYESLLSITQSEDTETTVDTYA
ncbi:hypothetical protein [Shewanella youngdeokensis]|uniref:Uncharacterized protein n=1 Tax=Shewanella youngdeokensis TaxID=2999068 RepID=A0ABZ0JW66_9GAMM|nr:hypothetical protein RGE70_12285 [Shewanella sp. DAU334]